MKKIGENIRFYRNLRGLTQTALARRVQVAPAYISQIEANQRVPSLKVTGRIAGVLGIDMSILVREADARTQEGRLSVSEKLDLLRTLMVAIEGETDHSDSAAAPEPRVAEGPGFVARELYSEPAFCVLLREFSAETVFGREVPEAELECHVILEGRARVVNGSGAELPAGACRSLSHPGQERLAAPPGTRVISAYGPRVPLGSLARSKADVPSEKS